MLLREFIERVPYGYWIEPNGAIHEVDDFQGHTRVAAEIAPDKFKYFDHMMQDGWVRIVAVGNFQNYWNIQAFKLNQVTVGAISKVLSKHEATCYIDYSTEPEKHYKTNNTKQAITILRALCRGSDNPDLERFAI